MIIFGTKNRFTTTGKGQFYCPKCRATRNYERKVAKRYFTLYFVPLIPMGTLGEMIECQTCRTSFNTDVLKLKEPPKRMSLAEMLNSVGEMLDGGMPVEYLIRDLTSAGLDRDVAQQMVKSHLGSARKQCPDCGLTYSPQVETCAECHSKLESNAE